jgi:RNase H-like domain found in reverse transcriptase
MNRFVDLLRQIFMRFRQHHLFLKASKCYFGYTELEYVGKVISENGLKMSQEKTRSVLDFPVPSISKQLKSFLGLTNYFRDFVRNHSAIVKPLNSMLSNYSTTKKVEWTKESLEAFASIKNEVAKCTTMHFINETDPIFLHTDASEYGIGGYLFQLVDGKEHPIAFVSKSLSLSQIRWAVIQKEAYAIFYVCMHLKSLLRDRKFTLRTDHRNLLYITENSNPMIVRWYMALSEYSCSHTLYVPYRFGHTVHGFGTRLACFSVFSFRFEDVIADPRSPNHLHHETCRVDCRSLFCSTTPSNSNVFSSLSFVSSVLSKQH